MRVVIIGGGYAGIKAALELNGVEGMEVTLISKNAEFEYFGVSSTSPQDISIDIAALCSTSVNISYENDEVTALNVRVKAIKCASGKIFQYDALLFCIGREGASSTVVGANEFAYGVDTMQGVGQLYRDLTERLRFAGHNETRVIVVGAGQTGVEVAGGLQEFATTICRRYGLKNRSIGVELIDAAARVVPDLEEIASKRVAKRLEKLGVKFRLNKKVQSCSKNTVRLSDGTERAADMIIWAAGSVPSRLFEKYPEIFAVKNGRVVVDEYRRVPKADAIYVLGDASQALTKGMAQLAIDDAVVATSTLKQIQIGRGDSLPRYSQKQHLIVLPVGEGWALLQKGKKVRSGAYAWLLRNRLHKSIKKTLPII